MFQINLVTPLTLQIAFHSIDTLVLFSPLALYTGFSINLYSCSRGTVIQANSISLHTSGKPFNQYIQLSSHPDTMKPHPIMRLIYLHYVDLEVRAQKFDGSFKDGQVWRLGILFRNKQIFINARCNSYFTQTSDRKPTLESIFLFLTRLTRTLDWAVVHCIIL